MAKQKSKPGHIYLYAVMLGTVENELGITGLFDSTVHTMSEDGIAAVVSEIPAIEKLRPERKHLAALQKVLNSLIQNDGLVLPVSFGIVADSEKDIRDMLKKHSQEFKTQIERVSGKVEMALRVAYDVPNVFEYLVTKYPDLKQERDQIYTSSGEPTKEQKIDLGQQFEQVQSTDRESLTTEVEKELRPLCVEMKHNKLRNEKDVMRISCLVAKDDVEEFKNAVDRASNILDDNFVIEYNGPLLPHNFVELRVQV